MFQDIKVSEDLNGEFLEHLKIELHSPVQNQTMTHLIGLDFNIYVLQVSKAHHFSFVLNRSFLLV